MSTFAERAFPFLLERFEELTTMAASGLPVEAELAAVRTLLQRSPRPQPLAAPKRRRTARPSLEEFDKPGKTWGNA
jgi:hypothetical protein